MKCIRNIACFFLIITMILLDVQTVHADAPYETYSYDFWGDDVLSPAAYLHKENYDSNLLGLSFSYPEDMFIYEDKLYIADTGNSRIVIISTKGEVIQIIDSFIKDNNTDDFNKPQGLFVTPEGNIYIADSGNGRIVELTSSGTYVREITRPATELITESQSFIPTKVIVDKMGRIYTICYGLNMGLVEFDKEGEFQGFMGATKVSVNPFQYLWKTYFATDAQKQRMETIIPTEYSNILLDHENFVYATINNLTNDARRQGADAIRRLNPTGTDVLRRLGNYWIIGDLYMASEEASWSKFVDVAATEYGCYFILDGAGGKIFAYDYDGNSLFAFGALGNREGSLQKPVAIALSEDNSTIFVLDSFLNSIVTFEITTYGHHLLSALEKNSLGDSDGAYEEWQEVLKLNANSEFAYIGIGKTFLKEGDYKDAMEYFKLGNSRKYYTKAFKFHRKEVMQDYFGSFMGVAGVIIVLLIILSQYKKYKRWVGEIKCNM